MSYKTKLGPLESSYETPEAALGHVKDALRMHLTSPLNMATRAVGYAENTSHEVCQVKAILQADGTIVFDVVT